MKIGDHVGWKWGNGIAVGVIEELQSERTVIESKGKRIVRNGSQADPAVIIRQDSGTRVLKLARELQIVKASE